MKSIQDIVLTKLRDWEGEWPDIPQADADYIIDNSYYVQKHWYNFYNRYFINEEDIANQKVRCEATIAPYQAEVQKVVDTVNCPNYDYVIFYRNEDTGRISRKATRCYPVAIGERQFPIFPACVKQEDGKAVPVDVSYYICTVAEYALLLSAVRRAKKIARGKARMEKRYAERALALHAKREKEFFATCKPRAKVKPEPPPGYRPAKAQAKAGIERAIKNGELWYTHNPTLSPKVTAEATRKVKQELDRRALEEAQRIEKSDLQKSDAQKQKQNGKLRHLSEPLQRLSDKKKRKPERSLQTRIRESCVNW